ncbi:aminotransferase class V-fold PLP-dependent enzyme, partial [Bacillus sp. SG-1]|uniref:aminotransferase class V-fold PLP-dependent enzyme n=1 Tax=Bacillus sp. SG-1 TaxID=161544 RepID=UPI0001544A5A
QSHEGGLRGGTVNTPGIAAFITAAQTACGDLHLRKFQELRKWFINGLRSKLQDSLMVVEAPGDNQLPQVIGLCIKGLQGQWVMLECNRRGFGISTGSACQTGQPAISKTIQAFGLSEETGKEFIRISLGKDTEKEDVTELVQALADIAKTHYEQ